MSTIIILFLVFITISYINHRIKLTKENKLFIPNVKIVEINNHEMHIYISN